MKKQLFELGKLVMTPGALNTLVEFNIDPVDLLKRHVSGDWGDMDEEDKQENELSIQQGFRILSHSQ